MTKLFGGKTRYTYDAHYNNPRLNQEPGFLAKSGEYRECTNDYGVHDTWAGERRYVMAARMLRQLTPRDSLVIANQHMATARYYGSRVSIRFDSLSRDWLDRSIRWLERRDVQTFLLVEDWELPAFRTRFVGERAIERLNQPPLAIYREPGLVYLYDLSGEDRLDRPVTIWSGTYRDIWAVPPAPEPSRLSFEP